ncbi:MAG: shikimate kinase AroL [Syntrophobacterales bacterium]
MAQALRLTKERNLVLIGGRACGKSSVGQALAQALQRPFVDLDEVLVAEAGCSIAEIVAEEGWPGFRRREKELVERWGHRPGQVLAPGGGVVLDPENVRVLREHGLVVWLHAKPATLSQRLRQDQGSRDFRPSLTGADPTAEMERVLTEREPLYRAAAHLVMDTEGLSIAEVVRSILEAIQAS